MKFAPTTNERSQCCIRDAGRFSRHLELEVTAGKYVLRLGAIDRNSEKIGTVDVPLEVGSETSAK